MSYLTTPWVNESLLGSRLDNALGVILVWSRVFIIYARLKGFLTVCAGNWSADHNEWLCVRPYRTQWGWNSYERTHRARESNFIISNFLNGREIFCISLYLLVSSIVVIAELSIPRLGEFLHCNGPHHKRTRKRDAKNKFIEPRIKLSYSLFSPRQGFLSLTFHCFYFIIVVISDFQFQGSVKCLCLCQNVINFTTTFTNPRHIARDILGPLESGNITFWDRPRSRLEAISVPP